MTQGSTFDWRALVFRTRYPTAVAFGLAERDRLTALKRTAFGYATINGFGKRSVLLYLGATPVVREFRELHNNDYQKDNQNRFGWVGRGCWGWLGEVV